MLSISRVHTFGKPIHLSPRKPKVGNKWGIPLSQLPSSTQSHMGTPQDRSAAGRQRPARGGAAEPCLRLCVSDKRTIDCSSFHRLFLQPELSWRPPTAAVMCGPMVTRRHHPEHAVCPSGLQRAPPRRCVAASPQRAKNPLSSRALTSGPSYRASSPSARSAPLPSPSGLKAVCSMWAFHKCPSYRPRLAMSRQMSMITSTGICGIAQHLVSGRSNMKGPLPL